MTSATVKRVIHGTATKFQIDLELLSARGGASEHRTVWVKTGMESVNNEIKDHERIFAGEAFFYREIAGRYETRAPACHFAEVDELDRSALVLEDLGVRSARFIEPTDAQSPDVIARAWEAVARYQAATWNHRSLQRSGYLANGSFWGIGNILNWIYDTEHWDAYSKRPRFEKLAPELRDRDLLLSAHRKLKERWWPHGPRVLAHGDAHVGQLYKLPNGEVRLLDWQCVRLAHWGLDQCNLVVTGLSRDDRRQSAGDLMQHYLTKLADFGVEYCPTIDDAMAALSAYAIHGLGWVMCMVETQPEGNCDAITERASAAALEMNTLETIAKGPERLSIH